MCEDGRVEDSIGERSAVIAIGQRASLPPFLTQKFIIFIAYFLHVKDILVKRLRSPVLAPSLHLWPHYAFTNGKKMICTLNRCLE
jgi:hypothetical protein